MIRKLSSTERLSDGGIGGRPISRFIDIVSYTKSNHDSTKKLIRFIATFDKLPRMMRRPWLRPVAIVIAVALALSSLKWPGAATIATILLLYVTFEYLVATRGLLYLAQENLGLLHAQIQRQERIEIYFDLALVDLAFILRVSNLGLSNFLLQGIHIRRSTGGKLDYDSHRIVRSGQTEEIILNKELYEDTAFGVDLEFTLSYTGPDGSGDTSPKCFNLGLGLDDLPFRVLEGLDDTAGWAVKCPKCEGTVLPNLHGLTTFEAASARQFQLEQDLGMSCPNHRSDFMLTNDAIKQQQRERENRRRI